MQEFEFWTRLHKWCVRNCDTNPSELELDLLLIQGELLNDPSGNGWTALHVAAAGFDFVLVNLLLERGADVHVKDISGATPLHFAAQKNNIGAIKSLLDCTADPLALDFESNSPFHWAVEAGCEEASKLLLLYSHSVLHLENVNGEKPIDIARKSENEFIIQLILRSIMQSTCQSPNSTGRKSSIL